MFNEYSVNRTWYHLHYPHYPHLHPSLPPLLPSLPPSPPSLSPPSLSPSLPPSLSPSLPLLTSRDLYGAVTTPLRIARTIVTGQSASVVCRLLYLLTYFIRCSEVQPGFLQEVLAGADIQQDTDQVRKMDEFYTLPCSLCSCVVSAVSCC